MFKILALTFALLCGTLSVQAQERCTTQENIIAQYEEMPYDIMMPKDQSVGYLFLDTLARVTNNQVINHDVYDVLMIAVSSVPQLPIHLHLLKSGCEVKVIDTHTDTAERILKIIEEKNNKGI